jgi:hypothetical protein
VTTAKDGPAAPLEARAPLVRDLGARTRDRLMVLLALLSGATGATGFLVLGRAFRQRSHPLS